MAAEPTGFRDFVVARQQALTRTARLLTGDWQLAEDLVQATLERVWPKWDAVVRDGDPEGYVRRALVNVYVSWWRRRPWHERPSVEIGPPVAAAGDAYADVDMRDAVARLLPTLPRRQRLVLVLRFYDDLTEAATAEVLGCSVGTVKSQTAKALTKLRAASEQLRLKGAL